MRLEHNPEKLKHLPNISEIFKGVKLQTTSHGGVMVVAMRGGVAKEDEKTMSMEQRMDSTAFGVVVDIDQLSNKEMIQIAESLQNVVYSLVIKAIEHE